MKRSLNILLAAFSLLHLRYVNAEIDPKNVELTTVFSQKNSNAHLSKSVRKIVSDYLLPSDHPVKEKLDQLFSSSRVFCDSNSMVDAGFAPGQPQPHTEMIVTTHPDFPGYIFKAFLDNQSYFEDQPEYLHWIKRIQGAALIRLSIENHGYQQLLKVPQKWMYSLPNTPVPPKKYLRKFFILVEEDMDIYNREENFKIWKSDIVTEEHLEALFTVINDVVLHDTSTRNCPFSRDGRIAFVDSKTCFKLPIKHEPIARCLSEKMKAFWLNLFFVKGLLTQQDLDRVQVIN
jgi:hypothetical protein